jgi:MSHA biogenesis protein MshP
MMRHAAAGERGMALIAALFMIVVVAALGTLSLRIGATQRQTASLALLTYRANAAAYSGLEFASFRANQGACPFNQGLVINGFTVNISCPVPTTHMIGLMSRSVWDLRATAVQGTYGRPDFVQRTQTRRVSDVPPGTW